MKWAVNMRLKTLTVCLDPAEVMALYVERQVGVMVGGWPMAKVWGPGLTEIIEKAAMVMFPLGFPGGGLSLVGGIREVEQVAWDEICDAE